MTIDTNDLLPGPYDCDECGCKLIMIDNTGWCYCQYCDVSETEKESFEPCEECGKTYLAHCYPPRFSCPTCLKGETQDANAG